MIKIAPSILSASFANVQHEVHLVEKGGADWLHLDIMDGHFVPNITFGPMIVKTLSDCTKLFLDTHLMIMNPDKYLEDFREAGAGRLTIHVESTVHLHRTLSKVRELGMKAGVTLNPSTPASAIKEVLPLVDLVLVMTVNPGFGGQKFITPMLAKIREIADLIVCTNPAIELEVDGGVDERNAAALVDAGATVLVAGNAIFSKKNIPQAIRMLRKAASH